MPTIVDRNLCSAAAEVQPNVNASPKKRMLRSDSAKQSSPMKLKSPRRFMIDSPNSPATVSYFLNFLNQLFSCAFN